LNEQKLYTDEELKKFEAEYAKAQNWGEHPYDAVTAPQHPPPQQVYPQQPIQPVVHDKKGVDPVYGI
jgi:hypothetical protein